MTEEEIEDLSKRAFEAASEMAIKMTKDLSGKPLTEVALAGLVVYLSLAKAAGISKETIMQQAEVYHDWFEGEMDV